MDSNASTGTAALPATGIHDDVDQPRANVTASEWEQGRRFMDHARDGVIQATKGLSEAQWKFKPAPECWSIAECTEHIVVVQELVLGPIRKQLAGAPLVSEDRDYKLVDAMVMTRFADRSGKLEAPGIAHPSGRWEPSVALDRFLTNCTQLIEYVESTANIRQRVLDAPPLKAISKGEFTVMDGYQWALAAAAHAARHTSQILEAKAAPRFPAE